LEHNGQTIVPQQVMGPPRRGISFAYITDTRPTQPLVTLAQDVDLLICESMYDTADDLPLAHANQHMISAESASIAKDAQAHALILTHFSPKVHDTRPAEKAARGVFSNTRAARDGMVMTLDFTS
jgi:ribonuclease Z